MASSGSFSIRITAIDAATKQIDAVNKRLAAMRAPAERLNKSVEKFTKLSGLKSLTDGFGKVGRSALDAARSVGRLITPLGALTGAASLAGMAALAAHAGDLANQLTQAASRLGITTTQLYQFQSMGKLAGASGNALGNSLESMGDKMQDALSGRNSEAMRAFAFLGINIRKGAGLVAKNAADVMPQVWQKIQQAKLGGASSATLRNAMNLLGIDPSLFKVVTEEGAKGFYRLQQEANKYGWNSDQSTKSATEFYHAQQLLNLSVDGFSNMLGSKLFPILTPIITQMADWVVKNRDWIATDITSYVQQFITWCKQMVPAIEDGWNQVNKIVQSFGGWKTVLETLVAVKLAGWALSAVAPFTSLASGILGAGNALSGLAAVASVLTAPEWLLGLLAAAGLYAGYEMAGGASARSNPLNSRTPEGRAARDAARQATAATLPIKQLSDFGPTTGPRSGQTRAAYNAYLAQTPYANTSQPRGIRNNNPLNLSYVPGQGAIGSDGRFGVYGSMQEGITADTRQLLRYQDRDHLDTVRQIVSKWAPPSENDSASYIAQVSKALGVSPDQPIDLHNQATAAALVSSMAKRETGRSLDTATVNKGVQTALTTPGGAPVQTAATSPLKVSGGASLQVHISGNTDGVTTFANTSGDLFGAPQVHYAMASPS